MSKPAIVSVDDDPQVLAAIGRDLRGRYGEHYRVVRAPSGAEALDALDEMLLLSKPEQVVVARMLMEELADHA